MTRAQLEGDVRTIMNESFGLGRRMGACQRVYDHDAEQRQRIEELEKELRDVWVDEHQTAWTRPTAWAYAQVCKALNAQKQQNAALREALENIVESEGLWTKNDMAHEAKQALEERKP